MSFDSNDIQRSALLLLGSGNSAVVYVAFAPSGGEFENGWLFGYSFNGSNFSQTAAFDSAPYGSGGGIWEAGAGPAYDGGSIYVVTGNGTFSYATPGPPSTMEVLNYGDSLLKLNPSSLAVGDYFAYKDTLNYQGQYGTGRCINDLRRGFGGPI